MQPLTPSHARFLGDVFAVAMQDSLVPLTHVQALMAMFAERRACYTAEAASDNERLAAEAVGKLQGAERALVLLKCAIEMADGTPPELRAPVPA